MSFSSCRSSVLRWIETHGPEPPLTPGAVTYLAIFRAAVAWEMPSSLATATVVPHRLVGIPDDLGLVGVHPLCQRARRDSSSAGADASAVYSSGRAVNVQNGVLGSDYQPLHQVFQLAHVAGPVVLLQKSQKAGAAGERLVRTPRRSGPGTGGPWGQMSSLRCRRGGMWMRMTFSR